VREVPGGAISGWLVRDVRSGDRIEVQPPSGSFTADLEVPGRHVLIAAGSGITPVLSIIASALRHPDAEATVLYGNRRSDSVMFADDIADGFSSPMCCPANRRKSSCSADASMPAGCAGCCRRCAR
jgi:ring-1,2-phenylacetyl-CoA epoxidase subunit PaaE